MIRIHLTRQKPQKNKLSLLMIFLVIAGFIMAAIVLQRSSSNPMSGDRPAPSKGDYIEMDYRALESGSVRILESQWGSHKDGDFYQLHVIVKEELGFVPEEIRLLSQTDPGKTVAILELTLNPSFECPTGRYGGFVGPAYETEPLLTRNPSGPLAGRPRLPQGTNLEFFDIVFRDQGMKRVLVKAVPLSGQCLSIFE